MKFKYNFHLFDDGSVFMNATNAAQTNSSLNVNVTSQTGKGQDLSPEMKTFYDRALIRKAEAELIHDQFAQKRPIPKGNGKTIEFRSFSSLPKALTPLTEGITPNGQKYEVIPKTATIEQYGAYISISDMLELTAFDNNMAEITRILGSQAGRTSDTITREVLCAGTNVMWANGKTGRANLAAGDVLTVMDIKKAVRIMKRNNVPKIGKYYVCLIHPDTEFDIMNDAEWRDASEYAGSEQIFEGELGKMYGVRFVESTEAKIVMQGSVPIYMTLMLGADAFGVTSIGGRGIETIAKQLGSGGTADPLNQRATIGWKMNKAVKILTEEYILRIEHTSSYTQATAN